MSLTSQEITRQTLTYKSYARSMGVRISDETNRLMNGLSDYLANMAQVMNGEDCPACLPAGAPTTQDLMADEKETRASVTTSAGQ